MDTTTAAAHPATPAAPLPALSKLAIDRSRALWRHLVWQLVPETFVGVPGSDTVPDAHQAALLAMTRGLHASPVSPEAVAARTGAAEHLRHLLDVGPVPALRRTPADAQPPSRLDLACDLLGLQGLDRLALELATVSELDPTTSLAARVLAGRLRRQETGDIDLYDDAFAAAGLGAGRFRRLCGEGGLLRRLGAIAGVDRRQVAVSPSLLAFLQDAIATSPLDEHAVPLNLPPEVLSRFEELRSGWLDVIERALFAGRPLLLTGMAGFGAPALVALVAARHGLDWRGCHAAPLVDTEHGRPSALFPVLHAEARLSGRVWLLHHVERLETHFRESPDSLRRWLEAVVAIDRPVVLVHEGPLSSDIGAQAAVQAGLMQLEMPPLRPDEREALLQVSLQAGGVDAAQATLLATEGKNYSLGVERTVAAVAYAFQRAQLRGAQLAAKALAPVAAAPTPAELRLACTAAMTNRLRAFGSRVDTTATWADLVLDADTLESVRNLSRFALVRDKLFDEWGFGKLMSSGRALSALFSGPSGTGKTMVAGLIAKDLGVELYRVDLSRVVSKYIGETEERLGALFSEAAQVGAAVLFDEADALFGKRTEIKSSNDRYANLEVGYLLQRLEEFDGVVILTTNFGASIDEAFLRRLRFRVQFPFPGVKERARLWDVMVPPELPQDDDGLDLDWMGAQFELSGGHVRNAVLRAAMYAADGDGALSMRMLYDAAAAEYRELGKLAPAYDFDT